MLQDYRLRWWKVVLVHATQAFIWGAEVQLHSLLKSALDMGGQPDAPSALPPGKQLCKLQSRSWRSGEEKNLFPEPKFKPRIAQPVLLTGDIHYRWTNELINLGTKRESVVSFLRRPVCIQRKRSRDNCELLGYAALVIPYRRFWTTYRSHLQRVPVASSDNSLRTFRNNLPVSSSNPLKMGPVGFPETSVRNYHYSPRNNPESAVLIYLATEAWNHAKWPPVDHGMSELQIQLTAAFKKNCTSCNKIC
jgi:hypothetical protein